MIGRSPAFWLLHWLGLKSGATQLTKAEQDCLLRHASGKRSLLEIGVMHGVSTSLLRRVMAEDGVLTGIDPHPPGRLGVSFERWIAEREVGRHLRGTVDLLRRFSHDALPTWTRTLDFLFIDGDHSWQGFDRDWRGYTPFVVERGIVVLHDSRSVAWRDDEESVAYTQLVVHKDPRFAVREEVDSMTVLGRQPDPK